MLKRDYTPSYHLTGGFAPARPMPVRCPGTIRRWLKRAAAVGLLFVLATAALALYQPAAKVQMRPALVRMV